jgi:NAD(P)-dependent dehydrogenase (short-subunit alcohol dehydrogenase family)
MDWAEDGHGWRPGHRRLLEVASTAGSGSNRAPTGGQPAVHTLAADPAAWGPRPYLLAYDSSKAALNAVTVHYAGELRGTSVKVNAANPGWCATDLNGHSGPRTVEQGAEIVVRLATLPEDGPTGGFFGGFHGPDGFSEGGSVPW